MIVIVVAGNQPFTQSSYITGSTVHIQGSSTTAGTVDPLQRFAERAEKSGIRLEVLPESNM